MSEKMPDVGSGTRLLQFLRDTSLWDLIGLVVGAAFFIGALDWVALKLASYPAYVGLPLILAMLVLYLGGGLALFKGLSPILRHITPAGRMIFERWLLWHHIKRLGREAKTILWLCYTHGHTFFNASPQWSAIKELCKEDFIIPRSDATNDARRYNIAYLPHLHIHHIGLKLEKTENFLSQNDENQSLIADVLKELAEAKKRRQWRR